MNECRSEDHGRTSRDIRDLRESLCYQKKISDKKTRTVRPTMHPYTVFGMIARLHDQSLDDPRATDD